MDNSILKKIKKLTNRINNSKINSHISGRKLFLIEEKESIDDDNEYLFLDEFIENNIIHLLDMQKEVIMQIANDHYWDTMEKDKDIILYHLRTILTEIVEREPEKIKIDEMELKFNDVKLPISKDVVYWEKGMNLECPKCNKKVMPTTSDEYHCSNCFCTFIQKKILIIKNLNHGKI